VEEIVRKKIGSGQWGPGMCLPRRKELRERWDVSMTTLQRAFDTLMDEGFVEARRRVGTFVSDHPPHTSQFALVIPEDPDRDRSRYSNFWDALVSASRVVGAECPCEIIPYFGVETQLEGEDYQSLLRGVRSHRLAGIIFGHAPSWVEGTPLTDEPGIPHAAIMSAPHSPDIAAVDCPAASFYQRALDHLSATGRKSVAVIDGNRLAMRDGNLAACTRWVRESPLESRPEWVHVLSPWIEEGARQVIRLLLSHQADRPDAIIIGDDNLVPPCTRGIAEADVDVPRDVSVVAHTNFPAPTEAHVPVWRIGFDARQILRECVERILEQRRGETPAPLTRVEPVTEEEYQAESGQCPERSAGIYAHNVMDP
jgi:DNA-binding LacI/PurR family transcriptional regulator